VEKKWTKLNIILIPIAVLAFIAYISVTSDASSERYDTVTAEGRLEQALSEIEGVGKVKVYFHYDENPSNSEETLSNYFRSSNNTNTVSGLLIVSEGAKDPKVQRQLLETISKVMEMPAHRIMIVPMESKGDEK
jgi:stage III sporulation protein AG